MAKRTVLKLGVILAGAVCICFMAAGLAGRTGADTYKGKPAGAEENAGSKTAGNQNAGNKSATGIQTAFRKEQGDTAIWGADYIKEIDLGLYRCATQDDIMHIGQLRHLERLHIQIDDDTADLSPLGNLGELKELSIYILTQHNLDLSFMEKLGQLEKLSIYTGEDADLSILGSLTGLKSFSMSYQDVPDLTFLRELDQLEEVALVKVSGLEDLSCFQDMVNLKGLCISYVDDVDLEYLRKCEKLEDIYIVGGNIRNPEALADLPHLRGLNLYDSQRGQEVFDLSPLAQLPELYRIVLIDIMVGDVSPLAESDSLTAITLAATGVEDISPLKDMGLEKLSIFGNESEKVKEQAEKYFNDVRVLVITEDVPYYAF